MFNQSKVGTDPAILVKILFIVQKSVGFDHRTNIGNEGVFVVGRLEGSRWRKLAEMHSKIRLRHSCELINDEKLVIMGCLLYTSDAADE